MLLTSCRQEDHSSGGSTLAQSHNCCVAGARLCPDLLDTHTPYSFGSQMRPASDVEGTVSISLLSQASKPRLGEDCVSVLLTGFKLKIQVTLASFRLEQEEQGWLYVVCPELAPKMHRLLQLGSP